MLVCSILVFCLFNTDDFIRSVVASKIQIPKCCAENEAVFKSTDSNGVICNTSSVHMDVTFSNVIVYDKNVPDKRTQKSFSDIFHVVQNQRPKAIDLSFQATSSGQAFYLSENGLLYVEIPNTYPRWIIFKENFYCIDHMENSEFETSHPKQDLVFLVGLENGADETDLMTANESLKTVLLMVSSVFLFLVLIVYMLIPRLRNLAGKVLMAYVFNLLIEFLLLFTITIGDYALVTCVGLSATTYFFFLASFCWMNVMSYDIWWTFRGYAKARAIHRRGETFKFRMYWIYAWGFPLAMTIVLVVIDNTPLTHKPWIIKPQIGVYNCFMPVISRMLYMYVPTLIMIIFNWIFFLMTIFNIWRLNRGTAVLGSPSVGNPQARMTQRNRFYVYLKLSIVMGINWVLNAVSALTPDFLLWYITDAYNLLTGLAIFLIFVCKKKIFRELKSRFSKELVPKFFQKSNPTHESMSTETTSVN